MGTDSVMKEIRPEQGPEQDEMVVLVLRRSAEETVAMEETEKMRGRGRETKKSHSCYCRGRSGLFLSVSVSLSSLLFLLLMSSVVLLSPVHSHPHINDNGGYENIVVTIGKEVPPIACQQLIQNIQGIFTSASDYLRRATDGRVYFHRVVIVVPPMWDTRACGRLLPMGSYTSRSTINDATIRIGTEHPIFGHLPWTQQSRGCGLEGDFISVGYHYILQFNETENAISSSPSLNANDHDYTYTVNGHGGTTGSSTPNLQGYSSVPTERAFVREWAKFRYGIFEELGFQNDPIYPSSYRENGERKPTVCSNAPLQGNWSGGCDESWNNEKENNKSAATCRFQPTAGNSHDNDRVTSSIMAYPQLRNVKFFCDESTHNRKAPTKQNFLCEGKSTSEVIYGHPDFRHLTFREPNVPVPAPEFIVKQITQPRFVLLVEETGNMNLRDVWKFLKLAVRKFIKYDLTIGSQIGLITVSTNDVRILANMSSLQSPVLRRALADKLPNYPNVDAGGNIAIRRGIYQAVDLLKRNQQRAAGSVIILISQGTVSNVDLEASLDLLRQEEVTLAAIEYPSLGDGKISILSEGTNGPHFVIRERVSSTKMSLPQSEDVSRCSSSCSLTTNSTVDNSFEFGCDSKDSLSSLSVVEQSVSSNETVPDLNVQGSAVMALALTIQFLQSENEFLRETVHDLKGRRSKEKETCYRPLAHTFIEEESTAEEKVYRVDLLYGGVCKVAINEKKRTLKTTHPFSLYDDKWIGFQKEAYVESVIAKNNAFAFMDAGGGSHFGKTGLDPMGTVRQLLKVLRKKRTRQEKPVKRLKKGPHVIASGGGGDSPPAGNSKKKIPSHGRRVKKPKRVRKKEGCGSLRWRCLTLGYGIDMFSVKLIGPSTSFICAEVVNRFLRFYSKRKQGSSVMFYSFPRMIAEDAARMLILLSKLQGHHITIPLSSPFVLPRGKLTKNFFIKKSRENEKTIDTLIHDVDTHLQVNKVVNVVTSNMISNKEVPTQADPLVDRPNDDKFMKKVKDLGRRFRERRLFLGLTTISFVKVASGNRNTGVGPTTHMSTFVQLINALSTIQKFFTEDVAASWPTMIHQAEYKGDSRTYIESNFSFEAQAAQSPAEFFIYTSNPNDPKINSVELVSPNGVKYTTQLSDLHDINVIKIDALINEPGVWRYRIERLADSHQSHFVQVVTKSTSEDLTVQLYTNVPLDKVANLSATPLILYVEVKKLLSPVIDAEVDATIVTTQKKWTIRLLDNGNGDPDVTRGDGVYSRYFIVPSGVSATVLEISARIVVNPYRAKFIVVDQDPPVLSKPLSQPCCGSFIVPNNPKQQYKIVSFGERSSNSLTLRISDIPPIGYYAPARIGDLTLVSVDATNLSVQLRWTAPGEDFDQGVSASYQVFYTPDKVNENWALLTEFTADLEAGVQDNVTITFPSYGSYKVSMRAVDFYTKAGKMSNIVTLTVLPLPKELDHTPNSFTGGTGNSLSSTGSTMAPSTDEFSKYELFLIIICGVAFVVLLAILIVVLLYCRKVGSSQRKSSKKNPGDTKISAITDPKSPIHWSASELLGEHEKTNRHSLYGGSVSPGGSGSGGGDQVKGQNNPSSSPSHHHHLNILPNGEYIGGGSSSRSRSSPDSYDDPDSPTPVPVSVRNRADYAICIDRERGGGGGGGVVVGGGGSDHSRNSYGHPHYQTPQNNGGLHPHNHPHAHFNGYANAATTMNVVNGMNGRFSTVMNSSIASSNSPLPPPPPLNSSSQQHNASHTLMHYDPDLQGSMSSVNSKKRNITMV